MNIQTLLLRQIRTEHSLPSRYNSTVNFYDSRTVKNHYGKTKTLQAEKSIPRMRRQIFNDAQAQQQTRRPRRAGHAGPENGVLLPIKPAGRRKPAAADIWDNLAGVWRATVANDLSSRRWLGRRCACASTFRGASKEICHCLSRGRAGYSRIMGLDERYWSIVDVFLLFEWVYLENVKLWCWISVAI